jgi:hypothetical protein
MRTKCDTHKRERPETETNEERKTWKLKHRKTDLEVKTEKDRLGS